MEELADIIDQLRKHRDDLGAQLEQLRTRYVKVHRAISELTGEPAPGEVYKIAATVPMTEATAEMMGAALPARPGPKESRPAKRETRPTKAAPKKAAGRPQGGSFDYAPIAAWIIEAKANGTYSQQAMEDHFGVPRTTVKNWLTRCRKLGLIPPEDRLIGVTTAKPTTPAPKVEARAADERKVLACSECDATFPLSEAKDLARHTIQAHRRGPLAVERTPVAA